MHRMGPSKRSMNVFAMIYSLWAQYDADRYCRWISDLPELMVDQEIQRSTKATFILKRTIKLFFKAWGGVRKDFLWKWCLSWKVNEVRRWWSSDHGRPMVSKRTLLQWWTSVAVLSNMMATSHIQQVSAWNMANAQEKLNFWCYLLLFFI